MSKRGRNRDRGLLPNGARSAARAPSHGKTEGQGSSPPRRRAAPLRPRFWETVPLDEMTTPEWESLCDGCGKCCVLKLDDADTGRVYYTNVTCRLFDPETRSCGQYALRRLFVPGCVSLSPDNLAETAPWMPASCAYRRLHEGRGLPDWHPLITGDPASVARAGQTLQGPTIPEYDVDEEDLEDHVIATDPTEDGDST